jgi:FtsZ-binding cell division protein ZapB
VAVAGSVDAGDVLVADPEEDGTAIARRSVAPTALPVVGLALDDSDGGTTDTVTALVGAGGLVRERDTAPADIRTAAGHAPNEPLHAAREAEQERLTALEAETEELREHVAALEAENDALRERNDALETRFEAVEDHLGLDGTGDQSTPADD